MDYTAEDLDSMSLLDKAQALIEVEKALTASLEKVEPWLETRPGGLSSPTGSYLNHRPRVRPVPTTMEQAQQVFAIARNLAARTSAPAGWNPNAPVLGFSTPSPLPHQLRGGSLAALQLDMARQQEREKKRHIMIQKQLVQQQGKGASKLAADKGALPDLADVDNVNRKRDAQEEEAGVRDPKRREVMHAERSPTKAGLVQPTNPTVAVLASIPQSSKPVDVTMNLSDTSSDEDDE